MCKNPIELRRKKYFQLSSQIALWDNAKLRALFEDGEASKGWGRNHTLNIDRSKVFVKRIPVTDLEYDNLFSTKNLYDLPTYYNYGVGSAGMGVFRELVMHIKTTNWVLDGAIATFPLMYHYRIIPFTGQRGEVNMEEHQRYIEYWGGSENVGKYMLDRANANYELVLFLEHIPYVLENWLQKNLGEIQAPLDDMRATIDFLRTNGILHLDAHYYNILTDGERSYLTDFGLVLDKSFALTKEEALFFQQNSYYDYGELLSCLPFPIMPAYKALSAKAKRKMNEKYGLAEDPKYDELIRVLLDKIEAIHADGILKLNDTYVASIVRYRDIIALMHAFFSGMWRNKQKDTKLHHAKLRRLLKETGFLPGADPNDSRKGL